MNYEIINHGYCNSQYFKGCGTAYTNFDFVVTGCGNNAKDAYNDAVEQIYMIHDNADKFKLPKNPKGQGITSRPCVPAKYEDSYWYVSILYREVKS